MITLRLDVEYDGRRFSGWAAQPDRRTVEGEIRRALAVVLRGEPDDLQVAGRTDTGVSATGQVVSVHTDADIDPERLLRGVNGVLPDDVAIRRATLARPGFDARRDALARAYEYRVLTGVRSPLRRHRVLWSARHLDLDAMNAAAAHAVGQHDFRAFTPTKTEHVFFDRTVTRCEWQERDDEIVFLVEADAFLRNMVRVLVGSMVRVGLGAWTVDRFAALLDGAGRSEAGPTAPAFPLTLVGVHYPADDEARHAG